MDENLAARILRLPAPILGELSVVPGPGWHLRGRVVEGAPYASELLVTVPPLLPSGDAWWPANPARAVAAILYPPGSVLEGCALYYAYGLIHIRLADDGDDHAAALAIIEAHAARSTP